MRFHVGRKTSAIMLSLLVFLLSACRAAVTETAPTPTAFPTFSYVAPTVAAPVLTVGAEEATASSTLTPDPDKIELGKSRYVALDCGSCHGTKGEGTAKGPALAGTKLTQDEFINMLRTGGKLGNDHLYSTNRLSDSGGKNLYLYVVSLGSSK